MTDISRTQAWLESLRPKTLPLAFAAIIVGTTLARWQGHFDPLVAGRRLSPPGCCKSSLISPMITAMR